MPKKNNRIVDYRRLSNRKKYLLTKDFCEDFKLNLVAHSIENDKRRGYDLDYTNECYLGFYSSMIGTYLFYEALHDTCVKHNVVKAIYEFAKNLNWYDSDFFDDDLVLRMVELGVIPYSTVEYEGLEDYYDCDEDWVDYQLIHHYKDKGYSVIQYDKWDVDNKEGLEEIYEDIPNIEIVWSM